MFSSPLLPPSLPIITHNSGNILEFLFNSPPPHLESTKTWGVQSGPDWQASGLGQDSTCFPWAPAALWRFLDLSDAAVAVVSGFLSSHTQLGAADVIPQFLLWRQTDMLKLGDTLSKWSLQVTAKGLALLF